MKKHIWSMIMTLFSFLLIYLGLTNQLGVFIHPRFHIAVYISAVVLLIMAVENYMRQRKITRKASFKLGYIIFLMPMLLFFIPTNVSASSSVAVTNGGIIRTVPRESVQVEVEETIEEDVEENTEVIEPTSEKETRAKSQELKMNIEDEPSAKLYATESKLLAALEALDDEIPFEVVDYNYLMFLDALHFNIDTLYGQKFTYKGMIYKDETLEDDEMIIGRMMMYCCAADAQIAGIICHYEQAKDYESNDWVEFTASLSVRDYYVEELDKTMKVPYLIVENIEPIEAPSDIYIYY